MLIEILLGMAAGILLSLLCIIPGIHPNMIATALPLIAGITQYPQFLISLIASLLASYNLISIIPAIFLEFSPDGISLTPSQQLLKQGRGHQAILLSALGALLGTAGTLLSIPAMLKLIPLLQAALKGRMALAISCTTVLLIATQKRKLPSLIIISFAAALGMIVLNTTLENPLLPLLTGFFALPPLLANLSKKQSHLPEQREATAIKIKPHHILPKTMLLSPLFSFLPGVGTSQALSILPEESKNHNTYLCLVGAMNAAASITAFFTFYSIQKSRNGVIATLAPLLTISSSDAILFAAITLLTLAPAFLLVQALAKKATKILSSVSVSTIAVYTLPLVIFCNIAFAGLISLAILSAAAILGIATEKLKVPKSNLMFSIIVPVLIFFLNRE